jgi:phage gp46-like protein
LGLPSRKYHGMAFLGDKTYVCVENGEIYMQDGIGNPFNSISQGNRFWTGMTSRGSNVYACGFDEGIYMQSGGVGNFVNLGQSVLRWYGMTTHNDDVYACVFDGSIYVQYDGVGNFVTTGQANRQWAAIASNGSDLYACSFQGRIYKQVGGVGNFGVIAEQTDSRDWTGIVFLNGDMYACVDGGDIYIQVGCIGDFLPIGQTTRRWWNLASYKNNLYGSVRDGDLFRTKPEITLIEPSNNVSTSDLLTITGKDLEGFDTNIIEIDSVEYPILTVSPTQIKMNAPDLLYGAHHVVVVVDGIESDPFSIFYSLKVVYGNPPSGDIKLSVTSPEWGDIVLNPDNKSELVLDDGLENYVSILLFTNRRADDSDIIPEGSPDRQGFWGDTLLGFSLGSKLWELQRMSIGNKLIVQAKQFAEDALKILIDEGIADSVSVDVTKNPNNKNELVFKVLIIKLDKGSIGYSYYYNWKNQMTRKAL